MREGGREVVREGANDLNQKFACKPAALVHVALESCFDIDDQCLPSECDVHDGLDVEARFFDKRVSQSLASMCMP